MKKLLILMVAAVALFSCSKLEETQPDETMLPVQKKLKFNIYASKDYSASVNDGTTAEIHLQAINKKRATGLEETVWDTVIAERQVKLYPQANTPLVVEKTIKEVIDHDDEIRYRYVITIKYNFGASVQNTERSEVIENGNIAKQLGIIL